MKDGTMCLKMIRAFNEMAIRERQDIVYRDLSSAPPACGVKRPAASLTAASL